MYSQKLIDEVKKLYPDSFTMQELAVNGNDLLGRFLDDSTGDSIHIDIILKAESLHELQIKAQLIKRKIDLYQMWCDEYTKGIQQKFTEWS